MPKFPRRLEVKRAECLPLCLVLLSIENEVNVLGECPQGCTVSVSSNPELTRKPVKTVASLVVVVVSFTTVILSALVVGIAVVVISSGTVDVSLLVSTMEELRSVVEAAVVVASSEMVDVSVLPSIMVELRSVVEIAVVIKRSEIVDSVPVSMVI